MEAWDQFAALYGPVLYRVALARGFQSADAENIVQEVMISVSRSISRWLEREPRGSFRAWLLRIARNEGVDHLRQKSTRTLGIDGSEAERLLRETAESDELSRHLDLEYERELFERAAERVKKKVTDSTWMAFWLTQIEGLSAEEAAQQLGTRTGNIYIARSRVMARIREIVQHYGEQS